VPRIPKSFDHFSLFYSNSNCKGTDLDSVDCLYKEMAQLTSSFVVGGNISNQYKNSPESVPRFTNGSLCYLE